jgi:hypothetical protein
MLKQQRKEGIVAMSLRIINPLPGIVMVPVAELWADLTQNTPRATAAADKSLYGITAKDLGDLLEMMKDGWRPGAGALTVQEIAGTMPCVTSPKLSFKLLDKVSDTAALPSHAGTKKVIDGNRRLLSLRILRELYGIDLGPIPCVTMPADATPDEIAAYQYRANSQIGTQQVKWEQTLPACWRWYLGDHLRNESRLLTTFGFRQRYDGQKVLALCHAAYIAGNRGTSYPALPAVIDLEACKDIWRKAPDKKPNAACPIQQATAKKWFTGADNGAVPVPTAATMRQYLENTSNPPLLRAFLIELARKEACMDTIHAAAEKAPGAKKLLAATAPAADKE